MSESLHTDKKEPSITPQFIGVRLKPPAVALRYLTASGAPRVRLMPVRGLPTYGPVTLQVAQLRQRHTNYLSKVPDVRLEKLVRLLQEVSCGRQMQEAVEALNKEYTIDPNQDLNKLSDVDIEKKKKIMDSSFVLSQVKPGDPDYEYDKRVDFATEDQQDAGWDSSDEFYG
ncbi:centrosomal protein of 19 kDa [Hyalella azteca]|uniref:Centrosomal protein of 19 kDa n=1 Tax=Hyalella azteca TaxID=294128 RepID=A0A8B7NWL4_HYAAZ|nr:centrosomal protein of 19 kDa [Hyalella azteca]